MQRDGIPQRDSVFHHASALHEFHVAAGYAESTVPGLREILHEEEHAELIEALQSGDLKAIARELADVVYVAYGSALSLGIDLDAALAEVHRANMHKAIRGVRRGDGKILKPADFVPPDMTAAVPDGGTQIPQRDSVNHHARQEDLRHHLSFLDDAPIIAGVNREAVAELVEALWKIANCRGCPGCRSVALNALGVTEPEGFVPRHAVIFPGRSEHHRACRWRGDHRVECHPDCTVTEDTRRV